jgi:hypothetical protein
LSLPHLAQVSLQEIIEEGADGGDRGKACDLVSARGDRGRQNVGGELERKPGDKPPAKAQPDIALVAAVGRGEHRP